VASVWLSPFAHRACRGIGAHSGITVAEPPRTHTGFLLHGTCGSDPTVVPVPTDDLPAPRPIVLVDGLTGEQLLAVVGDARVASRGPLDLEGHGSSGVAALSLALHQRRLGLQFDHVACIDARGETDPVSGGPLAVPSAPRAATRITLVPGRDDASVTWTAATASAFRAAGWTVETA
jgi:hypothetical protein